MFASTSVFYPVYESGSTVQAATFVLLSKYRLVWPDDELCFKLLCIHVSIEENLYVVEFDHNRRCEPVDCLFSHSVCPRRRKLASMLLRFSLLLTGVVNQNATILASPDLVPSDFGVAASPVKKKT